MYLLVRPPICSIRVFQNMFFSSEPVYSKNKATAQRKQSEKLYKVLAKIDKRSYDPGYSKSLRNSFYFAVNLIKVINFVPKKQHT